MFAFGVPIDKTLSDFKSIKSTTSLPSFLTPAFVSWHTAKIFKFLTQCFAWLRCWKSVSNHETYLQLPTAVLLEILFQYRSRAKHWFKLFSTLVFWLLELKLEYRNGILFQKLFRPNVRKLFQWSRKTFTSLSLR